MTSVEVDSKRPRLGSYEHVPGTTPGLPPPPPQRSSSRPVLHQIPSHQPYPHHPHHPQQPPQPSLPPHPSQPHYPPPPSSPHHQGRHPPPTPPSHHTASHPQQHRTSIESGRTSHHNSASSSSSAQHPPPLSGPPSASADHRARPYSSHASTLPMPTQHGESSEPSQYHHHGPQYHARQYSNEPLSARTPTTPATQGPGPILTPTDPNVKHAPQYYNDSYRGPGEAVHSPYHDQPMQPPMTMPPPQQPDRGPPYPSMSHQMADPSGDYWSYGQMITVQADGQPRRKAVRASQACESCRQKKCKCDEEKPICGNCKQNGTQCHYRDVPPPKQERTMMQVMDQISGLAQQMSDVGNNLNHLRGTYVRKDELRMELDSSIKSILHRELRDLRDDMRGVQAHVKRSSEIPQSPAARSQFASPKPVNGFEHGATLSRSDSRRQHEAQHANQGGAAYSPVGSQASDGGTRHTPQQHMREKIDPALKRWDPLAGQLSIPLEHSTAAHKLLISWHAIHPFYEGIIDIEYAQNYVMRGETQRGNLRIFGQGEGSDGISKSFPPAFVKQPSTSDREASSPSNTASSGDGNWGIGFDGPTIPAVDTEGGLNPDGTLSLDTATINRLYENFLQNIWILHPFLNKMHLQRLFERFIRRYGYDGYAHPAAGVSSPPVSAEQAEAPGGFKAPKRKRSDVTMDERFATPTMKAGTDTYRRPLERSMNNALMLLILALGRVCEHKGAFPPPVSEGDVNPAYANHRSPSHANTPHSVATPLFPPDAPTPDGFAPSPYSDSSAGRYNGRPRNIDRIPGLAYFAYAVGILGEHHGSPDLVHVQSSVLAGIYYGQMARVIDSWRWINSACTDCLLLFKDESSFPNMEPDRADAIRFAYWTCLQLESDILAELDLPHSGVSRLEDRMELPNWSTLEYATTSPEYLNLCYYWAQIHLRKILNRAHSALYNSGKERLKNPGWTIYSADDLADQLNDWRNTLPIALRWEDHDEPARYINDARLRGKYYGARYIIHRPFLHHMLELPFLPKDQHRDMKTKEKQGMIGMARNCVDAAKASTTSFDGLHGRPILTNIFGTAHAQFGNILVLAACYTTNAPGHNVAGWFMYKGEIDMLIARTVDFISHLAPLAPTMQTNLRILYNTQRKLREYTGDGEMSYPASSSFGSSGP